MTSLAYAGLWIFVFSVPWENVIAIPGLGAISRLFGMMALGLALLAALLSGRVRRPDFLHVAALLFVLWAGAGVLVFEMMVVPKKFWTYVQLFAVLWMIWELAPSKKRQLGLLTAYVFGAYVSALSTIMVFRGHTGSLRHGRFAAAGFDANDLAAALALALPMAWYLGTTYRQPIMRWICRGFLPIGLIAIGLTGSRGGLVATMVALLVVPLTMRQLSPGRLAAAIAILCICGSVAIAYIPETIVQRLASTGSDVEEAHLGGRFKIWVAGVHAFAVRPIAGYGTSAFRGAVAPWMVQAPQVAHNSYLSVLVEQGLIGFILYISMFIAVFKAVLNLPRIDRRFALVLLATLAVVLLPLTWEDHKPVWFILAALLGLARAPDAWSGEALPQPSVQRAGPIPSPAMPRRARQPLGPRRNAG